MAELKRVLSEIGLEHPDGRPLHAVPLTPEQHQEIRKSLRIRLTNGDRYPRTAGHFVLWAAEYIRSCFEGGQLTWEFVFRGLGLREDQRLGQELVEAGLGWWRRRVHETEAGMRLYLYSLMAEGGLPQALIEKQGTYSRFIKGLLAEIEAEGGNVTDDLACRIASSRTVDLPQIFHSKDFVRLITDLVLTLVRLRTALPPDVPIQAIDRWLDIHKPGWRQQLPLRLSDEAVDLLIRPVLRMERKSTVATGPIARRNLIWNEAAQEWCLFVQFAAEGFLAQEMLPEPAKGMRMRLLPRGLASDRGSNAVVYTASPEEEGWDLRLIGAINPVLVPFDLDTPLTLESFADGQFQGEVEVIPAMSLPDEEASLWREAEARDGVRSNELLPISGSGKTRSARIWLLTPANATPVVSDGLVIGEPQSCSSWELYPIEGTGEIRLGGRSWKIMTGSEEEASESSMIAIGKRLPVWRQARNGGAVFLGNPDLYGQYHSGRLRRLVGGEVSMVQQRRQLMTVAAAWIERTNTLARMTYVAMPKDVQLALRETGAGQLEMRVAGLPVGVSLTLTAGSDEVHLHLPEGEGYLPLAVKGAPPGIVTVQIKEPVTGKYLELVAPWPAQNGMILGPDNLRLDRHWPISILDLHGWRAIPPGNDQGEILLRMGDVRLAMRMSGEISLAAHAPLIRAMLAHASPDAEVKLSLITGGVESSRLEIRRYHHETAIVNQGGLRLGLPRDFRKTADNPFSQLSTHGKVHLQALNIHTSERVELEEFVARGDIDLFSVLPSEEGLWLVQALLDGKVQRAAIWSPRPLPASNRGERIAGYAAWWHSQCAEGSRDEWCRQWDMIKAAAQGGDAGVLDQVQALADCPAAAIRMIMVAPKSDLSQALALNLAAPVFWPALPLSAFQAAVSSEYSSLLDLYGAALGEGSDAQASAREALAQRISDILVLRPELAGHFGVALTQADLVAAMPASLLGKVLPHNSEARFVELAQEAARRVGWLPSGMKLVMAQRSPPGLMKRFNTHTQALIDAPIVTAEIATGLRSLPDRASMLTLINLRLVDPGYFDAAVPLALDYALREVRS